MAYNRFSREHDPAVILAAAIKYPDFPSMEGDQRKLVKMFYENINVPGGKVPVEKAESKFVYRIAQRLHQSALRYAVGLKPLTAVEGYVVASLSESSRRGTSLGEKACQMLEGGSDNIRDVIRESSEVLYPVDMTFDPKKFI